MNRTKSVLVGVLATLVLLALTSAFVVYLNGGRFWPCYASALLGTGVLTLVTALIDSINYVNAKK